jgi:hypothetical protein
VSFLCNFLKHHLSKTFKQIVCDKLCHLVFYWHSNVVYSFVYKVIVELVIYIYTLQCSAVMRWSRYWVELVDHCHSTLYWHIELLYTNNKYCSSSSSNTPKVMHRYILADLGYCFAFCLLEGSDF